jgi:uncharacterized membrane protein (UPF0127 family)
MNGRRIALLFVLLLGAAALPAATTDETTLDRYFERSTLQIATPDARLHHFNIWVADREAQQQRGLMHVKALAPDAGMLFIYPSPRRLSMWMKNTYVPLDMLFVRPDGRVDSIVENTEPLSLAVIESQRLVLAVIELNAGTAARLKIGPGAQVIHPAFAQR